MRGVGSNLPAFSQLAPPPLPSPATLPLHYWWEGDDYSLGGFEAQLPPRASTGTSGAASKQMRVPFGVNAPTVGPVLNAGKPPLSMRYTPSEFMTELGPVVMPTGVAFSGWWLGNWDATGAPSNPIGTGYDNQAWLSDYGQNRYNFGFKGGGSPTAQLVIFNGGFQGAEVAIVPGVPQLIYYKCTGATAQIQNATQGSGWVSNAIGGFPSAGSSPPRLGVSSNPGGTYMRGLYASGAYSLALLSDANFALVRAWLQQKWGPC